ncbi:hypothetical protein GLOIN_2v1869906, partial [Rhizophagus irregularis DAOM 181602=DAOM 197198]
MPLSLFLIMVPIPKLSVPCTDHLFNIPMNDFFHIFVYFCVYFVNFAFLVILRNKICNYSP